MDSCDEIESSKPLIRFQGCYSVTSATMNPKFLGLVDGLQFFAIFVAAPALSIRIAYAAWKGKPLSFDREKFGMLFVVMMAVTILLFVCAQRMKADVRTPLYFIQLGCSLLGALSFGIAGGCMLSVFTYRLNQAQDGMTVVRPHTRVLQNRYWVIVIVAATAIHALLMFLFLDFEAYPVLSRVALGIHVAACVGPFWMLADWFIKKQQRTFKSWMWLIFVPWGFLWYYFEIHRHSALRERTFA